MQSRSEIDELSITLSERTAPGQWEVRTFSPPTLPEVVTKVTCEAVRYDKQGNAYVEAELLTPSGDRKWMYALYKITPSGEVLSQMPADYFSDLRMVLQERGKCGAVCAAWLVAEINHA